jgi:hypothetical protein
MRYLLPLLVLAGCAQPAPAPQIQYVTRTVPDCSWLPKGSASTADTKATKQWMVAYENARQTNCAGAK